MLIEATTDNPTMPAIPSATLSAQEEAYAIALASGQHRSQADAYRAVFKPKGLSDPTIWSDASRMASKVRARVAEIRDELADVTLSSHLIELDRLKRAAEDDKVWGASVRAEELRGRVKGYYVERHEIEHTRKATTGDLIDALRSLLRNDAGVRAMVEEELKRLNAQDVVPEGQIISHNSGDSA